jgi:hypothetical protein
VKVELEACGWKLPWLNFKVLSQYVPGVLRETTKTVSQDSWSLGRDFNLKRRSTSTRLHGAISQKAVIFNS